MPHHFEYPSAVDSPHKTLLISFKMHSIARKKNANRSRHRYVFTYEMYMGCLLRRNQQKTGRSLIKLSIYGTVCHL